MGQARNLWSRRGIFYYARMNVYSRHVYQGTITKRLDFMSYHMILWMYGEEYLNRMATTIRTK